VGFRQLKDTKKGMAREMKKITKKPAAQPLSDDRFFETCDKMEKAWLETGMSLDSELHMREVGQYVKMWITEGVITETDGLSIVCHFAEFLSDENRRKCGFDPSVFEYSRSVNVH
jgi:hypothetical protein